MKLLQLNAWMGRMEKQLAELLKNENPDFVCLQEAISIKQLGPNLGMFLTVEEIQDSLNLQLAYSPQWSFKFMSRVAGFGNAIFSKRPIKFQKTLFTRLKHIENFDAIKDDYNARNLLHAAYDVNGETLHVLTHHGHHIHEHKNGDEETMRQCKVIADYCQGLEGKVILTGDFNLAPDSQSIKQINNVLTNLSVKYDLPTTRSHLTNKKEVCDYIFVNDRVRVKNFRVSDALVSDHVPLIIEFE